MNSENESALSRLAGIADELSRRVGTGFLTFVVVGLIAASLVLAFQSRDGSNDDGAQGGTERIESIGADAIIAVPVEQEASSEREAAAGPTRSSQLPTVGSAPLEVTSPDSSSATTTGLTTTTEAQTTSEPSTTEPSTTEAPTTSASITTEAPTTVTTEAPTTTVQVTTIETKPPTTEPPATIRPTAAPVSLVNGGFDQGVSLSKGTHTITASIPGWTSKHSEFEVWHKDKEGVGAVNGSYLIELNANVPGSIYQDFATTPGTTIAWRFHHRGRDGTDSLELQLGSSTGRLTTVETATTGTSWQRYGGTYVVPEGQTSTRIAFESLSPGSAANLLDRVSVTLVD